MARVHMYKATIKDLKEVSTPPPAPTLDIDYVQTEDFTEDLLLSSPSQPQPPPPLLSNDSSITDTTNNDSSSTIITNANINNTTTPIATTTTAVVPTTNTNTTSTNTTTTFVSNNDITNTSTDTSIITPIPITTSQDTQLNETYTPTAETIDTDQTSVVTSAVTFHEGSSTNATLPDTTDLMDQAAAATALQLLGLAQQRENIENLVQPMLNDEGSGQKRGTWTREEDELLLKGIKKFGYGRWKEIASMIPGRKGKQLKQRWDNTLAAKYVDQEWLKNKINDNSSTSSSTSSSSKKIISSSSTTTSTNEWANLTQKITEKMKMSDASSLESVISQALLSTFQTTAASDTSSVTTTAAATAAATTTPASFSFTNSNALSLYAQQLQESIQQLQESALQVHEQSLQQQHHHQQQQATSSTKPNNSLSSPIETDSMNSETSFSQPQSMGSPKLKRKRSDPALATTQSDAVNIFACATPIKATINNQTQSVYPCLFPNCGKTFARLYNLKSHSRTHTDERPFICSVCQIAFSRNHDLKRHTKIHGGDKPYSCPGCNKTFSRLDALKRHKANERNRASCMNAVLR